MSKYQGALRQIISFINKHVNVDKVHDIAPSISVIKELVVRDKPIKPIGNPRKEQKCASCKSYDFYDGGYMSDKYCRYCGQAIDWSYEE